MSQKKWNVAIGFATGRKNFYRILRSYVLNCLESGLLDNKDVGLNLFVAYDLEYRHTSKADFVAINPEISKLLDSVHFIGKSEMLIEKKNMLKRGIITEAEAKVIFRRWYALQRNIILYKAIENHMDCLLFLDDDEYPVALTKSIETDLWGGQRVIQSHLKYIKDADITCGHHCGYISPIPYVEFSHAFPEDIFKKFIQSLSHDIINWDTIRSVMKNGGVTYADKQILLRKEVKTVQDINGAKFISGSNLCINLQNPKRVFPFYNPPGARGEDTFLSTCLTERKVLQIPCYTFHDGFGAYRYMLAGVLPVRMKMIRADSSRVLKRFYTACIGWIRYKPLYIYITDREHYRSRIAEMTESLEKTLPFICRYFKSDMFMMVLRELKKYDNTIDKQYTYFENNKLIWSRLLKTLQE